MENLRRTVATYCKALGGKCCVLRGGPAQRCFSHILFAAHAEFSRTAILVNDALETIYPASGNLNAAVRHVAQNSGDLKAAADSVCPRKPFNCTRRHNVFTCVLHACSRWI